jgi:hypothetical protein
MEGDRVMSRRELLAALKKAQKVYVWVRATKEDGCYFLALEKDVRHRIKHDLCIWDDDEKVILAFTDDETGTLYIN